jgi:Fibronectin type III domain
MRANLQILRDFYQYSPDKAVTFGRNIATNLDPTIYTSLPVPPDSIKTLSDDLSAKQAAIITGGSVELAARDTAFDALTAALDNDADAVEMVVKDNMEMLLATGYLPASTNRTSSPLDDTAITGLFNNGTTQVLLRLQPVVNAKAYEVQTSTDGGKTWLEACVSTQARRIVLVNLVPGTTYLVRARAVGGSTGASNWTGPGSIMST